MNHLMKEFWKMHEILNANTVFKTILSNKKMLNVSLTFRFRVQLEEVEAIQTRGFHGSTWTRAGSGPNFYEWLGHGSGSVLAASGN